MTAPQFSDVSAAKLTASGIDPTRAAALGIRPVAVADDLPDEFRTDPRAVVPGMVVDWTTADGDVVPQYRPDVAPELPDPETGEMRAVKYLFPAESYVGVAKVGHWPSRPGTILLVEGSLQSRSVSQWVDSDTAVLATPGCWGWSHDRLPSADLAVVEDTDVLVILDADAKSNLHVYNGGDRLAKILRGMGATSVRFPDLGLGGTKGVDDMLGARATDDQRRTFVGQVPELATHRGADKPAPVKPKPRSGALGRRRAAGLLEPNDTVLATTWSDGALGRWRYRPDAREWLRYRDGRWSPGGRDSVYDDVARFLVDVAGTYYAAAHQAGDDGARELNETGDMLLSHNKITAVLARASGHSDLHVVREDLDTHPWVWVARNGVIDLTDQTFREHEADLMASLGSDVDYDPAAGCPRFEAFLADIQPDPEMRAFLMRLFGAAMIGEVRADAQVLPVFYGESRNGKGALMRIMSALFGSMSVEVDTKTLIERRQETHTQEIAKLARKRLATAQETGEHERWDAGKLKRMTGGDPLIGRFLHQNDEQFMPSHMLILATNNVPNVPATDKGFWRRFLGVPFDADVYGREDTSLEPDIVSGELSGVLNHVLAGLADYLESGLRAPEVVTLTSETARAMSDPVIRYAQEQLTFTKAKTDAIPVAELAHEIRNEWWPREIGRGPGKPVPDQADVIARIRAVYRDQLADGPQPRTARWDGETAYSLVGVTWKSRPGRSPNVTKLRAVPDSMSDDAIQSAIDALG